jgi:hypothetical protein
MIDLAAALIAPLAKLFLTSCLGEVPADIGDNLLKLGFERFGDWSKARTCGPLIHVRRPAAPLHRSAGSVLGLLDWRRAAARGIALQDVIGRVGPLPEATRSTLRARSSPWTARGPCRRAALSRRAAGFIEQHVHPVLTALMVVAEVIAIEGWEEHQPAAPD